MGKICMAQQMQSHNTLRTYHALNDKEWSTKTTKGLTDYYHWFVSFSALSQDIKVEEKNMHFKTLLIFNC